MIYEINDHCEETKIAINLFQRDKSIINTQGLKKVITKFLAELQSEEAKERNQN